MISVTGIQCFHDRIEPAYTGKLVIDGACHSLVVQVLSNVDPHLVNASYTDSATGVTYHNVFAVGDICSWGAPDSLAVGDSFRFSFVAARLESCNLCLAFYPKIAINSIDYLGK